MKLEIETQHDSGGYVETSYKLSTSQGKELLSYIYSFHPLLENFVEIEMISFHAADGITYPYDTVTCVYKDLPNNLLLENYGAPLDGIYLDYYALKYPLKENQKPYLKVYDKLYSRYPIPSLPNGTRICSQYGIGVHYGEATIQKYHDIYFLHDNRDLMRNTFKDLYPDVEETHVFTLRGYGVTYNVQTFEIIKLKRYIFSNENVIIG